VRPSLHVGGTAWVLLSALLCLGAVVVWMLVAGSGGAPAATPLAHALDWQAALGLREPWRLWTCAWVHGSTAHLLVNVAGGAVIAFVGWRARLPPAAAVAWLLAWPGTQLLMAAIGSERLAPAMPHYFGLSGVLHAGVAVLGLSLAWPDASAGRPLHHRDVPRSPTTGDAAAAASASRLESRARPAVGERDARERWIGLAILAGTLAKVALEVPWDLAPHASAALGVPVAPVAHACGLGAGVLAWTALRLVARRRS
jgi:membrane associated rhomboid family serine protease